MLQSDPWHIYKQGIRSLITTCIGSRSVMSSEVNVAPICHWPSFEGCFDGKLWFLSLFTLLVSLILKYTTNKMETGLNWFWGDYADEQIISPWVFQFGKVADSHYVTSKSVKYVRYRLYRKVCNLHILVLLSQKLIQTTLDHTNTVFIIFFRNKFRNFSNFLFRNFQMRISGW